MSESKKEKIMRKGLPIFFIVLLLLGGTFLWNLWRESRIQIISVTAYMKGETLDLNDTVRIKDLTETDGTKAEVQEGQFYELTIRYAINGIYGNWAVYGCSEMETKTTFIARKEHPEVELTVAFDTSKITDGSGNSFDPETMSLIPYATVEEQ